jgi:hypothetical protein
MAGKYARKVLLLPLRRKWWEVVLRIFITLKKSIDLGRD